MKLKSIHEFISEERETRKIKIISGHLTAHDKKAVNAILDLGKMEGKVGKKEYHITKNGNEYTIKMLVMDRGLVPVPGSKLRLSTYISKVEIKE